MYLRTRDEGQRERRISNHVNLTRIRGSRGENGNRIKTIIPKTLRTHGTIQISSRPQTKWADTHRKSCKHLPSGMETMKFYLNDQAYVDVSHKLCVRVFKSCAVSGLCCKRISNAVYAFFSFAVLTVVSQFFMLSLCKVLRVYS